MMFRTLLTATAAMAALGAAATAQNYNLDPTYGTVSLSAGFSPDPYVVNVQSGGSIPASNASSSCRGYIANAPDVRLNYSAGSSLPLILSVASNSDTTLVVNAPNGSWYCDDDGGEGTNPSLRFNSPMSGQYDIWIGTYGSTDLRSAALNISELYSQ